MKFTVEYAEIYVSVILSFYTQQTGYTTQIGFAIKVIIKYLPKGLKTLGVNWGGAAFS
jgi:hypothetical protein